MLSLTDGTSAVWRSSPSESHAAFKVKKATDGRELPFWKLSSSQLSKISRVLFLSTKAISKKYNVSSTLQTPINFGKGQSKLNFPEFYHRNTRGETKYRELFLLSQFWQLLCNWFLACWILPQLTSIED